ncbi:MAG: hypothetical protein NZO58_00465 [Gemmataceae bacterium]|nr:hypothetical protein [Gemmataceae bacterium]
MTWDWYWIGAAVTVGLGAFWLLLRDRDEPVDDTPRWSRFIGMHGG